MRYSAAMKTASRTPRSAIVVLIAAALLALLAGLWAASEFTRPRGGSPEGIGATYLPGGKPLPAFELTDHTGEPLSLEDLKGQWTFLFFGYTFCPDVCPTTLAAMNQAWQRWEEDGLTRNAEVLFISVDPERDSPERLAQYVPYFNPAFLGATGPDEQLQRLTRSLGIAYARHEEDGENYLVDHSAAVLLVNPEGELQAVFRAPHRPPQLAEDFRRIRAFYQQQNS